MLIIAYLMSVILFLTYWDLAEMRLYQVTTTHALLYAFTKQNSNKSKEPHFEIEGTRMGEYEIATRFTF
jgi:hypothetical protein